MILKVNKDLKRLDLISKTPILSIAGATVQGLSTIRALQLKRKLLSDMDTAI